MHIKALLNLKVALLIAEREVGLSELSDTERMLVYGALHIADENSEFLSEALRSNEMVVPFAHATYHRALKNLLRDGVFVRANGSLRNRYKLVLSGVSANGTV
jgi:hypothetical protein